jgi:hypothetical protein
MVMATLSKAWSFAKPLTIKELECNKDYGNYVETYHSPSSF